MNKSWPSRNAIRSRWTSTAPWRAKQVQFTKTVPKGRLVEVQSSHDIDLDKPELVIQEVQRILEMA